MSEQHVKAIFSAVDNGFTSNIGRFTKGLSGFEKQAKGSEKKSESMFSSIFKGGLALKGVTAGFVAMKNAVGDAVSRVDTLNQFPKMMQQLGYETDSVEKSMDKLVKGIDGLPTRLDDVVSTTQQLTMITGDLEQATDLTLALNNAFLASGAGAEDASRGLVQYTQMLSSGKVDMQSWKTLQETMPLALTKTAESFGFAGTSAENDFYEALQSGKITFNDFSNRLIELNKGVDGFAEIAKTNSKGIATSFKNIQTAVVNGTAKVITAFDNLSKALTGRDIAGNLDVLKKIIANGFDNIAKVLSMVQPLFKAVGDSIRWLARDSVVLRPVLIALASGFAALMIVEKINKLISEHGSLQNALIKNLVAKPGILKKITTQILAMNTAYAVGSAGLTGFSAVAGGLGTVFAGLGASVKGFLASIGPVGWAIGGVSAALGGLYAILSKTSPEMEKLSEEAKESANSMAEVRQSVEDGAKSYERNVGAIESTGNSYKQLASRIEELANTQNRTSGQTREMNEAIASVNGYLGENIIQYDKSTDSINMTAEAMQEYIDVAMKEKELEAVQQRLLDLKIERGKIDAENKVITDKLTEAEKERDGHLVTFTGNGKLAKKAVEDLTQAKNDALTSEQIISEEEKALNERKIELYNEVSEKEKEMHDQSVALTEEEKALMEERKKLYEDFKTSVINSLDEINTKSKYSLEQVEENWKKNAAAAQSWGENLGVIAQNTSKEFVQYLQQLGIENASLIEELANKPAEEQQRIYQQWLELGNAGQQGYIDSVNGKKPEVEQVNKETGVSATRSFADGINGSKRMTDNAGANIRQGVVDNVSNNLGSDLNREGNIAGSRLSDGLESTQGETKGAAEVIKSAALEALKEGYTNFKLAGELSSMGFMQGLKALQNPVKNAGQFIAGKGVDGARSTYSSFVSAGRYAGQGFVSGISSQSGSAYNAAYRMASNAMSAVKRRMKIHSPSREMMKLGNYSVDGFVNPIKDRSKEVYNAFSDMVDTRGIENELNSNIAGLDASMSTDISSNINSNVEVGQQPAEFTFNLFGKTFKAFVDDISKVQNDNINLNLSYS